MKLHSISTSLGSACLAEIAEPNHPVQVPDGWGLIFWGRCDRAIFGKLVLSSTATWIADYSMHSKQAIIMWPIHLAGQSISVDTSLVDAVCPTCGSTNYVSNGAENWKCSSCGRQWRKAGANPRGGKRVGAGRKRAISEADP